CPKRCLLVAFCRTAPRRTKPYHQAKLKRPTRWVSLGQTPYFGRSRAGLMIAPCGRNHPCGAASLRSLSKTLPLRRVLSNRSEENKTVPSGQIKKAHPMGEPWTKPLLWQIRNWIDDCALRPHSHLPG